MFYFVYPTYLIPDTNNWFLPNTEIIPFVQNSQQEQNSGDCKQALTERILVKKCEESMKQTYFTSQTKKQQKMTLKIKNICKDQEYHPELYISKKSKKSQQLENRNVVPNIIRLILSFIQKKGKSIKIVQKLFKKSSIQNRWNIKRFYLYQSMIRSKMNNYVNEETLKNLVKKHPEQCQLYSLQEQEFYNKITRTIIDYFLRQEISVCILTSKRMDRTKKAQHLNALRKIHESLPILLSE